MKYTNWKILGILYNFQKKLILRYYVNCLSTDYTPMIWISGKNKRYRQNTNV